MTLEWKRLVQALVDEIDTCILEEKDEALTLCALSARFGYSDFYMSRKFREVSGMTLKDYIRYRKLAFALKEVRDTSCSLLQIAVRYGFSTHESFSRAFKQTYGVSPSSYRENPQPVVLRTVLRPFDCYLMEGAGKEMEQRQSVGEVQTYFVRIPAHKFLHIRNYQSIGYWDFWQKQKDVPGQDCETICGLLDSIPGKLDDAGGLEMNAGSGQLMAWINEPNGRLCSWGIPLAEAYGVRLPVDYDGLVPPQMQMMDVPEGEYVVFEHGPFDYEAEGESVEAKVEQAMQTFAAGDSPYTFDLTQGRVWYFYHDCNRFFKYVRPIRMK